MNFKSPQRVLVRKRLYRSFSRGVGSIVAIRGGYFPYRVIPPAYDLKAIESDWRKVGDTLRSAADMLASRHR